MNPYNSLPRLQSFESIDINESLFMTSGQIILDTREAKQFQVIRTNQFTPFNTKDYFTPKEVSEIIQSLMDLQSGNFKSTYDTEELFADLDRK